MIDFYSQWIAIKQERTHINLTDVLFYRDWLAMCVCWSFNGTLARCRTANICLAKTSLPSQVDAHQRLRVRESCEFFTSKHWYEYANIWKTTLHLLRVHCRLVGFVELNEKNSAKQRMYANIPILKSSLIWNVKIFYTHSKRSHHHETT